MSKLLTGLMEAERKRRALAAEDQTGPSGAGAPANAAPGPTYVADMPAGVGGDGTAQSVRNRVEQGFAAAQAAAARLEAERAVVSSLDRRIEEETAALAKAQREERRTAELAAAAAARTAKDSELARLSEERGAAERCAADRAAALLAAERAAAEALQARVAAEEAAVQETRRRIELEAEASRAAAERLRLERELRSRPLADRGPEDGPAGMVSKTSEGDGPAGLGGLAVGAERDAMDPGSGSIRARGGRFVAVGMSLAIAALAGYWLGRQGEPIARPATGAGIPPVASVSARPPPPAEEDLPLLRLDHGLRNVPVAAPVAAGKP